MEGSQVMSERSVAARPTPLTLRSMPVLLTGAVLSGVLVTGALALWVAMGPYERALWTWPQVATMIFFIGVMVTVMLSVGLSTVRVDDGGVTVRNALRTSHYEFSEIHGVAMNSGDPWAYLVVDAPETDDHDDEGENKMVLAIQRAEGQAADIHLRQLREAIAAYQDQLSA